MRFLRKDKFHAFAVVLMYSGVDGHPIVVDAADIKQRVTENWITGYQTTTMYSTDDGAILQDVYGWQIAGFVNNSEYYTGHQTMKVRSTTGDDKGQEYTVWAWEVWDLGQSGRFETAAMQGWREYNEAVEAARLAEEARLAAEAQAKAQASSGGYNKHLYGKIAELEAGNNTSSTSNNTWGYSTVPRDTAGTGKTSYWGEVGRLVLEDMKENNSSPYNAVNYWSGGTLDAIKGAFKPEKPMSLQHWVDSGVTVLTVVPAAEMVLTEVKPLVKGVVSQVSEMNLERFLLDERGSIRIPGGTGKSVEQVLDTVKSYEQARNKAFDIIGDIGANSEPYVGRLGTGEGKIVGRQSADGKVRWRLDYDPNKGPHINVEDYRNGKGADAIKVAIPFEGDMSTVESLLKHLNK